MSQHLLRLSKSIPLLKLRQGGTLLIRSSFPGTSVKILPEWRDDGLICLQQSLLPGDCEAHLKVIQEDDTFVSMGRSEPQFSIELFPQKGPKVPSQESTTTFAQESNATEFFAKDQKVILDDGRIVPDSEEYANFHRVEYSDGMIHASSAKPVLTSSVELSAHVPEKVNLSCALSEGGSISIDAKIEGDINLFTKDGDIVVSKLRGHHITIHTHGCGHVYVSDVLEAQSVNISTPGRIRAKRIHGTNIDVQVVKSDSVSEMTRNLDTDDEGASIDISSLYVSGTGSANLIVSSPVAMSGRAIRVKSSHGHVAADASLPRSSSSTEPVVELGGVNGTCDVSIDCLASQDDASAPVGRIHVDSLSPESVSFVTAASGNLHLTLDRKVESDLRLLSSDNLGSIDTRALLEDNDIVRFTDGLQELDRSSSKQSDASRISVVTDAFTCDPASLEFTNIDYVEGWVDNKSAEPDSRFDVKAKGGMGLGKIRLEGAASQALDVFSSQSSSDSSRPLFAVATNGQINVETLSWLGAIARRYGLDEEGRDIGRTASRKGRDFTPVSK